MAIETLFAFLLASVALTLMPGPDILYVLTESLSNGSKRGFTIACGLVSGLIVHTTLAATGLGLIITQEPLLFDILRYAGAAYLGYLTWLAWLEKPEKPIQSETKERLTSSFGYFRQGFVMNVLNPKVTLFFLTFLPQFVDAELGSPTLQLLGLGLLFMVQAIVVFGLVSVFAGRFARLFDTPWFWRFTYWLKVVVLGALAIGLALA